MSVLDIHRRIDYFFFQAEDGIRDLTVTGVQTCALPISLKGQHLQWILPHEVKDLCVRCASNEHKTQDCDAFEHRGRRPIPKSIQQNYNRFKPVGYVRPPANSSRSNSHSKSRSRSRSRTHQSSNASNRSEEHTSE